MTSRETSGICILHISDLHFSKSWLNNQGVVLRAFFDDLSRCGDQDLRPDLIIFSGDLVNNPDEPDIYDSVIDNVIFPLFEHTKLTQDSIFLVPGNHDIHRTIVVRLGSEREQWLQTLHSRDSLNNFYDEHRRSEKIRLLSGDYFAFHEHMIGSNNIYSDNFLSLNVLNQINLAVICLNTAWSSSAGINSDYGNLLFPEQALNTAFELIPPGLATIVVGHHPFEWLTEESAVDLRSVLQKHAHLYLCGHIHDARPSVRNEPNGNLIFAQAGALFSGRQRFNGYSIIRYSVGNNLVEFILRSYFDKRREFDVATDVISDGRFYISDESRLYWSRVRRRPASSTFKTWLRDIVAPGMIKAMDEGLATVPTSGLFIPPRLSEDPQSSLNHQDDSPPTNEMTFEQFLEGDENFLVIARPEFGKSTLLRQIAISYLRESQIRERLPLLLHFTEIRTGRDRILSALRTSLGDVSWPSFVLRDLLTDGSCIILIDDFDWSDRERVTLIYDFFRTYSANRFIITTNQPADPITGVMPRLRAETPIPFKSVHLRQPSRHEIRQLVKKWPTQPSDEIDKVLDRLFQTIIYINVPVTAVNATILLSIFETEPDFKPINQATLIERFVELLLEKQKLTDALRANFDFRIKTHFLSALAFKMVMDDEYRISYENVIVFASEYLDRHGFSGQPRAIIDSFCTAKILLDHDGTVSFRYRAFLEFFVAKRLEDDAEFRRYVFSEEMYLKFVNEIEYYAALRRDSLDLLDMLGKRFAKLDAELGSAVEWDRSLAHLDGLKLQRSYESPDAIYEEVEAEIRAPKADEEERDALWETGIPRDIGERQEVYRPFYEDIGQKWMAALTLYSGVLRNCELIEDGAKRTHLYAVLKGWSMLTLHSFVLVPSLVKHRHYISNGVAYHVLFPKNMKDSEVALRIYLSLPRAISELVRIYLGSEKLERQLGDDSLGQSLEENIVKFFRRNLYVDLKLKNFMGQLESLEEELQKSDYLYQAFMWKAKEFLRRSALSDLEHESIRHLIAKMVAQISPVSFKERRSIEEKERKRLEKGYLLERLKVIARERRDD